MFILKFRILKYQNLYYTLMESSLKLSIMILIIIFIIDLDKYLFNNLLFLFRKNNW